MSAPKRFKAGDKTSNGLDFGEYARCFELATPLPPLSPGDRVRVYGYDHRMGLWDGELAIVKRIIGYCAEVDPVNPNDSEPGANVHPKQLRRLRKKASK
jgi:hypothetical protein